MIYHKFLRLESIYYFCEIDYIFKTEQWKDVVGFQGIYQVSDLGRVKSLSRITKINEKRSRLTNDRILSSSKDTGGYIFVCLYENSKPKTRRVHLLVAASFLNHISNGTHDIIVDHKSNFKIDNRTLNLQLTSTRVNNSKDVKNKTSKYTGVSWDKNNNKWLSQIVFNKKTYNLGRYKTELEAKEAYENRLKKGR